MGLAVSTNTAARQTVQVAQNTQQAQSKAAPSKLSDVAAGSQAAQGALLAGSPGHGSGLFGWGFMKFAYGLIPTGILGVGTLISWNVRTSGADREEARRKAQQTFIMASGHAERTDEELTKAQSRVHAAQETLANANGSDIATYTSDEAKKPRGARAALSDANSLLSQMRSKATIGGKHQEPAAAGPAAAAEPGGQPDYKQVLSDIGVDPEGGSAAGPIDRNAVTRAQFDLDSAQREEGRLSDLASEAQRNAKLAGRSLYYSRIRDNAPWVLTCATIGFAGWEAIVLLHGLSKLWNGITSPFNHNH
jgi:hypothetical protein